MKLIFLYGLPATGKLTVARELALVTGYPVFHNHLAVDLLLSIFEFGSAPFVELREQIWLGAFREAARSGAAGLIFTFAPEATVRASFIPALLETMAAEGASVEFAELTCPEAELKRRLKEPSRAQFKKLNSVELYDQLRDSGSFDALEMPRARVSIDTSLCTPARAALEIARALELAGHQARA